MIEDFFSVDPGMMETTGCLPNTQILLEAIICLDIMRRKSRRRKKRKKRRKRKKMRKKLERKLHFPASLECNSIYLRCDTVLAIKYKQKLLGRFLEKVLKRWPTALVNTLFLYPIPSSCMDFRHETKSE